MFSAVLATLRLYVRQVNTKHNDEDNIIDEKKILCVQMNISSFSIYICVYLFRLVKLDVDNKTPAVL